MKEKTLVIIKPDAMKRKLTRAILARFQEERFLILARYKAKIAKDLAETHYREHKGKPFFEGLIKYMTSTPVEIILLEGQDAINRSHEIVGPTDPRNAPHGTLRGDLRSDDVVNADGIIMNLVHASDSAESAKREIELFFGK